MTPSVSTPRAAYPTWHTALLVGLLVAVAVAGTVLTAHGVPTRAPTGSPVFSAYLPTLLMEWSLFAYVVFVGGAAGEWRQRIGGKSAGRRRARGDLLAALVCVLLIAMNHRVAFTLFGVGRAASTDAILPHSAFERAMWLAVVLSAAVCEEVVFRGYLLPQLARIARSVFIGIALQALLFGAAHLEQGPIHATLIAIDGALLGVSAVACGNLRACFLAHLAINLMSV